MDEEIVRLLSWSKILQEQSKEFHRASWIIRKRLLMIEQEYRMVAMRSQEALEDAKRLRELMGPGIDGMIQF
jgi:hypothetical protein